MTQIRLDPGAASQIAHTVCPAAFRRPRRWRLRLAAPAMLLLSLLALVTLVALVALGVPKPSEATEMLVDGIAAQVGHRYVLVSEVESLARPVAERMRTAGAPASEIFKMRNEALGRLIEEKLIEGVVARLEMEASQQEIDNTIRGIAADNGLTVDQLKASVESHGLTMAEYRSKLKGELERSRVLNALVRSRIRIEADELELAYLERYGDQRQGGEQVNVRHIMVGAGEGTGRDERTACQIAQDAADQIRAGKVEFGEMARRTTEMNPEQAGELGWYHTDEIAPWMSTTVAAMEEGDVSDAIPMPFGCNVIQLAGRRTYSPVSLQQAEPQLREEISRHKMEKEYMTWLETVRKQTYIARKGIFAENQSR